MAKQVLGPSIAKWAGRAGLASLGGSLLTGFLGVGVGDYDSNTSLINSIVNKNLSELVEAPEVKMEGIPEESDRSMSDEDAFRMFNEFAKNYK